MSCDGNKTAEMEVHQLVQQFDESTIEEGTSVPETPFELVKDLNASLEAKERGNKLYLEGDMSRAIEAYEEAIAVCPHEQTEHIAKCYGNCSACYFKLNDLDKVVEYASKAIELDGSYMKALLRRGDAAERLEKYAIAFEDYKKIVELDPSNRSITSKLPIVEKKMKKQQEEQTAEALGQLKDLGNKLLGNFGISLDNFKTVQDPNTGSYSISFQQ